MIKSNKYGERIVEKVKPLTLRLPMSTWVYLKKLAVDQEITLTGLIVDRLNKYKNTCEKRLTQKDTTV